MDTAHEGDRVTDGDRCGVIIAVLVEQRRGLSGGICAEAQVRFDDGEVSFQCIEDLQPEPVDDR